MLGVQNLRIDLKQLRKVNEGKEIKRFYYTIPDCNGLDGQEIRFDRLGLTNLNERITWTAQTYLNIGDIFGVSDGVMVRAIFEMPQDNLPLTMICYRGITEIKKQMESALTLFNITNIRLSEVLEYNRT